MNELQKSRAEIDQIDEKIAALFEERMKITGQIAEYKKESGKEVFDKEREAAKLQTIMQQTSEPFYKRAIYELFSQIMSISRKLQYSMIPVYNEDIPFAPIDTVLDTFSEDTKTKIIYCANKANDMQVAIKEFFGTDVHSKQILSCKELIKLVQEGEADYGVCPCCGLAENTDLFIDQDIKIVVWRECFLIITNKKIYLKDAERVNISFELPHEYGSLYRVLSMFTYHKINLTQIASTPINSKQSEFRFSLEFEGNLQEDRVKNAINAIKTEVKMLHILGNYKL